MIVTVSTVKDNLHNVQRYVEGNLAGGADHLVLFLDQGAADVEAYLDTRPEVTYVVTNTPWWRGDRPHLLNKRQRVNANIAKAVLAFSPWATWLFHIDADEVVQLDRQVLDAVPRHVKAVGIRPLEVVSTLHPEGEPRLFKRLLDDDELDLLHQLQVLDEPSNSFYYRSHIAGKVGVRPRLDIWLGIHKAADRDDNRWPLVFRDELRMLHFESYSGEDFVRKWTSMVRSGPKMHFGTQRLSIAYGLRALVEMDLPRDVKAKYLEKIYQRHMEDPVDQLAALDLLVDVDVRRPTHRPTPLPEDERRLLAERLEMVRGLDKWSFIPDSPDAAEVGPRLRKLYGTRPVGPLGPPSPLVKAGRARVRTVLNRVQGKSPVAVDDHAAADGDTPE